MYHHVYRSNRKVICIKKSLKVRAHFVFIIVRIWLKKSLPINLNHKQHEMKMMLAVRRMFILEYKASCYMIFNLIFGI